MQNDLTSNPLSIVTKLFDVFPAIIVVYNEQDKLIYSNNLYHNFIYSKDDELKFSNMVLNREFSENDNVIKFSNYLFRVSTVHTTWIDGNNCKIITCMDITSVQNILTGSIKQSNIDLETGALNEQGGIDFLEQSIVKLKILGNVFTFCYMTIDNLQSIHDNFSKSLGDKYIIDIVSVVHNSIRKTDVLARMSQEEFMLVFPKCRKDVVENIMGTVTSRLDVMNEALENDAPPFVLKFAIMEVNPHQNMDVKELISNVKDIMNSTN